jgi:hypothetical protein
VNPADASYCYYDGSLLEGHTQNGGAIRAGGAFPNHFVFPSGLICRNFDQLAQACQDNWGSAVELLQEGYLEKFLGGLGRVDLAFAAREASRFPDRDRGLDQLLAKLPSGVLEAPKLNIVPSNVNLGQMQVGDNRTLELHLTNQGSRLLYGTVTAEDCKWLTLGDAPGAAQKVFQFNTDLVIPIQVRGANLRAGNKPVEGKLLVESNGGNATVTVRCEVPVKPFTEGVLAGAKSPRQVAEKAKANPKEAAPLFEKGVVADWYKANGWTYPVQGPSAAGLGAVQQFFEALGLTAPPKVEINTKFLNFQGNVGASLRQTVEVKAQEKRPVFAYATSDQPWLVVERAHLNGRYATIAVTIPAVPNRPGEILQGKVTVTSNGNQRFVVPVTLTVNGTFGQPILLDDAAPVFADVRMVESPVMPAQVMPAPVMPTPVMPAPVMAAQVMAAPVMAMEAGPSPVMAVQPAVMPHPSRPDMRPVHVTPVEAPPRRRSEGGTSVWVHLIPAGVLLLALLGMVIHDILIKKDKATGDEFYPIYKTPLVQVKYLTEGIKVPDQNGDMVDDVKMGRLSLRFGILAGKKKLTFDERGASNNACLKIDGKELILGNALTGEKDPTTGNLKPLRGRWLKDKQDRVLTPLGKTKDGRKRDGYKAVFLFEDSKIQVTQTVEVVPNPEPRRVKDKDGSIKEMRLLDTVLVKYEIENKDTRSHQVGLRFLLDTFIGTNDGVPFTIPGVNALCDSKREFIGDIPDYIEALEYKDVKRPGTVANIAFRFPGLETPGRVTLGVWPKTAINKILQDEKSPLVARAQHTEWEVPFLTMQAVKPPDSAVTMYWNPKELAPGKKKKRTVGFAYGLGNFAGGGRIGLSTSKFIRASDTFTVTALISNPKPGETVTLTLPEGLELKEGEKTQDVPRASGKSNNSPVTWKVIANKTGQYRIRVKSSNGDKKSKAVPVKQGTGLFG